MKSLNRKKYTKSQEHMILANLLILLTPSTEVYKLPTRFTFRSFTRNLYFFSSLSSTLAKEIQLTAKYGLDINIFIYFLINVQIR